MKNCSHCSREVMDSAKFCPYCGANFENAQPKAEFQNTNEENAYQAPPLPELEIFNENDGRQNIYNKPQLPPNKALVWLILSSVLTFFGCACFGVGILQIPTIITSAIAQSRYNRGEYESSERLARTSKILFFSLLAFSVLIIIVISVFYYSMFDFVEMTDGMY